MPRRKAPMPNCQGKLSDGKPCPKTVKKGQKYCRWHDPEDESWREVYERLEKATPEEKTRLVLDLIKDHPEQRLVLPEREGWKANLRGVNLPGGPFFYANLRGVIMPGADLHAVWF